MTLSQIALFASLIVIVCVPVFLVFYRHYSENWLQFVGLVGMAIAGTALFDNVYYNVEISNEDVLLLISIALFLLGVILKVVKFRLKALHELTRRDSASTS